MVKKILLLLVFSCESIIVTVAVKKIHCLPLHRNLIFLIMIHMLGTHMLSLLLVVICYRWQHIPVSMRGGWIVASTLLGALLFERLHMSLEFGAMFIGLVFAKV